MNLNILIFNAINSNLIIIYYTKMGNYTLLLINYHINL